MYSDVKWCFLVLDKVFNILYIVFMTDELLTINQVGKILGVSRSKVYDYINNEKNPLSVIYLSERTPRIKKSDLDVWIEEQNKINE